MIRATSGSAGYDIPSSVDVVIPANSQKLIPTNIYLNTSRNFPSIPNLPSHLYAKIESRSSMAMKGIWTGAGVVDSDYRGEVKVLLRNFTDVDFEIKKGDRIAQMVFVKIEFPYDSVIDSIRGDGGFGSTG